MKYKILFLDVDGTVVNYEYPIVKALPSAKVTRAIKKASEVLTVCLATGRPYFLLENLLNHLDLVGFAVINDGAQVIDLQTKKIFYEKVLDLQDAQKICDILKKLKIDFFINDSDKDIPYQNSYRPKKPYNIFLGQEYPEQLVDEAIDKISKLPHVKVHKTHLTLGPGFSLLASHAEATKLHGIIQVSKLLKVKREETIGVGDSGNDFPLLMASGFKVAMGNAAEDLKDIADYVAPSVSEDGVAEVIEKFVLSKN